MTVSHTAAFARRSHRRTVASLGLLIAVLTATALTPVNASAAPSGASTRAALDTPAEITMIKAVLATINHERAAHHLSPVHLNTQLRVSAHLHNLTMARTNQLSHQLPGEAYFATRMTLAGYHWSRAGENIAWNSRMTTAGVVALEVAMYNEKAPNDGHRVNILSSHFHDVGVDVHLDHAHHRVWLTTDFGHH